MRLLLRRLVRPERQGHDPRDNRDNQRRSGAVRSGGETAPGRRSAPRASISSPRTALNLSRLLPCPLEHHRALLVAPLIITHATGKLRVGVGEALVDLLHVLLVVAGPRLAALAPSRLSLCLGLLRR